MWTAEVVNDSDSLLRGIKDALLQRVANFHSTVEHYLFYHYPHKDELCVVIQSSKFGFACRVGLP